MIPRDTLARCWDVPRPTNKHPPPPFRNMTIGQPVAWRPSNIPAYLRNRSHSHQKVVRAATRGHTQQVRFAISPSHSVLTPGQPVPALTHVTPSSWQDGQWSTNVKAFLDSPASDRCALWSVLCLRNHSLLVGWLVA